MIEMANIVPGVIWQPVNVGARAARRKGRGLVGHVAVSGSKNLVPNPAAGKDWHFYLPKEGAPFQYIDLDKQCWSTGAGNASLVAFESEGGLGTMAQVNAEPWTENQLNWAAHILRYMHDTEGVPLRVMESSATAERGFGTHRLGVPGYMAAGGEVWSSSRGKACPGDAKHAQRFEIVRRAADGSPLEDDMPDMNTFLNTPAYTGGPTISQVLKNVNVRTRPVSRRVDGVVQSIEMLQEIADAKSLGLQVSGKIDALTAALQEVQRQVSDGADVDLEAVLAAAREGGKQGVADAIADSAAVVSVQLADAPKA